MHIFAYLLLLCSINWKEPEGLLTPNGILYFLEHSFLHIKTDCHPGKKKTVEWNCCEVLCFLLLLPHSLINYINFYDFTVAVVILEGMKKCIIECHLILSESFNLKLVAGTFMIFLNLKVCKWRVKYKNRSTERSSQRSIFTIKADVHTFPQLGFYIFLKKFN